MDMQAEKVFQPTWDAKLLFVMKNAGLPVAGLLAGYAIYAKGVDFGMIILMTVFIIMFVAVSLKACTTKITVTPIAVVITSIFTKKSIPIPAIQRVRIEQGLPQSRIKNTFLLIETTEGKSRTGVTLLVEQKQELATYILELIHNNYPQNYESVEQYSNNPDRLLVSNLDFAQTLDGGIGRVFEPSGKVKLVLILPFFLVALALFIDTHSVLVFSLTFLCLLPFVGWFSKKMTISSNAVITKSLWGRRTILLRDIRVAKLTSGGRNTLNLMIQTDKSKYKIGGEQVGFQTNEALAYLLEQIRVNYPENYEMVRQNSMSENLWRR